MRYALVSLVLLLAGCVNFGEDRNAPPIVHYVLADPAPAPQRQAAPDPRTLLVLDTSTSSFYDTDTLAFSRSPNTRSYYQFARWTERPGKRFADLLRARLDAQGSFATIAAAGGHVRGELLLDTELVEFYHDASDPPGSAHVVLRVELIDLKSRSLIGRAEFDQRVEAASYDAAGAAGAFNLATGRVLDELLAWLDQMRK
jgi:cholesterol transport system auxiliary component